MPSQANPLAGLPLDYLIGADGQQSGREDGVTETPYGVRPAALGASIAYCNLRREDGEPAAYGPYLLHDDIYHEYHEGRPDPAGPGFERNILEQLDACKELGHRLVEQDNPDSYPLQAVLRALDLAQQRGLGVIAKNPGLMKDGALDYVAHQNVFGIIVEKDCGTAQEMDALRRRANKPDLPVWFVSFGEGRSWARQTAQAIQAAGYSNMGVTYSPAGEYGSSEDVLLPRIADSNKGATMVAIGDGHWRLAKSLITLINQIDAKFPVRDRSNDGSIGDAAHMARRSDHDPDSHGVVRALDITHDPAHGVDTYKLAENLRIARDRRIKYVISNRRIFGDEGYASRNGVSAWTWGGYHGANPHDMHVHVSVNSDDALADDTSPWPIGDIVSAEHPRLKIGDSGEAVKEAQSLLGTAVTGTFDAGTETAVRAFQARSALAVDGIVGPYTWRALLADARPGGGSAELSPETIRAIVALAGSSPIAHYQWHNRGPAPAGYIKGMAVTFGLVCQKWKAGDSAVRLMAQPNSGNDNVDALSWYDSEFRALGMSNAVAGLNTLRHLFVLLLGLGMRESSGNCFEGRDMSAGNTSAETAEAGLFQQSHNSFSASPELARLMATYQANPSWGFQGIFREGVPGGPTPDYGSGAGADFQRLCKLSPAFAVEAAAAGLRVIGGRAPYGHWGPISRKEAELRQEADALFAQVQQIVEVAAPVPTPLPVPVPTPTPAPIPSPPPVVVDPVASALEQLIALFRQRLLSMQQPLPLPVPPAPSPDLNNLVQQLVTLMQGMRTQTTATATTSPTADQQIDQLRKLVDIGRGIITPGAKGLTQPLGQVNGALGQTIGNLLDGKKSAIGILGALVTGVLQSAGPDVPLDKLIPMIGSSAGLGSVAMPLFLALSAWGVLGKIEKWAGASPQPPKPQ